MVPVVRPRNVALFGIVSMIAGGVLTLLPFLYPIAAILFIVGLFSLIVSYGYLAVSLIEEGAYLKYAGWALIGLPILGQTGRTSASTGVQGLAIDIAVALVLAALVIWIMQLCLRATRWLAERYYPPLYPT